MSTKRFNADSLSKPPSYHIENDRLIRVRDVIVHEFNMGDVEDPDLYASQPLIEWEKSESGQWVMENATETPFWRRATDLTTYGYRYQIVARFREQEEVFFKLKFGNNKS